MIDTNKQVAESEYRKVVLNNQEEYPNLARIEKAKNRLNFNGGN